MDPIQLSARLIECPSITPNEAGAIALLEQILGQGGFACTRITRGGVENLYAKWGNGESYATFGFNGHIDVVPPGDVSAWRHPPFEAHQDQGVLYGRGACDMKSGVAAFVCAALKYAQTANPNDRAIAILITGDEEGASVDGTRAILDWMRANNEGMDCCIVGEPTSVQQLGDTIKVGRRGSMHLGIEAIGVQGHAAYPHRAKKPVARTVCPVE